MQKKLLIITGILLLSAAMLFSGISVSNRTLSKQLEGEDTGIFIPSGIADSYKDTMSMSFDDGRVWIYSLNEKETAQMKKDLESGKWIPFEKDSNNIFLRIAGTELPTGNSYEYVYRTGSRNLLFVFDETNNDYYCISMTY